MEKNDPTRLQHELEEVRNLRGAIAARQDGNLKILAFSASFIPALMALLLASGNLRSDFKAISLGFLCLGLFVIGCFILVIRNVYTIKTIGGYIATYYEAKHGLGGWETKSALVAGIYARYKKLPKEVRKSAPQPWFVLNGGTVRTLSYFFVLLSLSILGVYLNFVIDLTPSSLGPIYLSLIVLNCACCAFVLYLALRLHTVARRWKAVWTLLDSDIGINGRIKPDSLTSGGQCAGSKSAVRAPNKTTVRRSSGK